MTVLMHPVTTSPRRDTPLLGLSISIYDPSDKQVLILQSGRIIDKLLATGPLESFN
ncbi:hypothetical protein Pla100_31710 [Neorhodopirellula pilleata]|uniref:Uncharacterized protein n=1 Tax=Neorhodopirellula pilleata TaxID=2714738 RepID=A0A5C6A811_9BACT|nr:hypothetical protein Pla100_31710 [Neorhodopirellula pilleata]